MNLLSGKMLEAKVVYAAIRVYNLLLDLILGFMLSAVVLQLFGVNLLYAIVPAVMLALLRLIQEYLGSDLIRRLSGKYDKLDERLKTALEHQGARNVIVEDLLTDVTRRMDDVETSSFLNSGEVSKRVWAIVILSFMLLTATVLDLHSLMLGSIESLLEYPAVKGAVDGVGSAGVGFDMLMGNRWENSSYGDKNKEKLGAQPGGDRPGMSQGPIPGKGSGTGSEAIQDIYGAASSANVAGNNVDFRLHPEYGGDIEIRETGGHKTGSTFKLDDVQSVEECADCVIGPEHEEVVRKYFEKILPET
jgi:hypothetical protein